LQESKIGILDFHQRQQHKTVTIVLALATLGSMAQIGTFPLAKPSKGGDIALQYRWHYCIQASPMYTTFIRQGQN